MMRPPIGAAVAIASARSGVGGSGKTHGQEEESGEAHWERYEHDTCRV